MTWLLLYRGFVVWFFPSGWCVMHWCLCVCGALMPSCEYADIHMCLCVHARARTPWQWVVLRETSLSDLSDRWRPLFLPMFSIILLSGPGSGAYTQPERPSAAPVVVGMLLSLLGPEGKVGVLGLSHPHAPWRPHCSATYFLAQCPWNLFSAPDLLCKVCPKK